MVRRIALVIVYAYGTQWAIYLAVLLADKGVLPYFIVIAYAALIAPILWWVLSFKDKIPDNANNDDQPTP